MGGGREGKGNWGSIGLLGRIIRIRIREEKNPEEKDIRERINYVAKIGLFLCNRCSLNC